VIQTSRILVHSRAEDRIRDALISRFPCISGAALATATCGGYIIITTGLLIAAATGELHGRKTVIAFLFFLFPILMLHGMRFVAAFRNIINGIKTAISRQISRKVFSRKKKEIVLYCQKGINLFLVLVEKVGGKNHDSGFYCPRFYLINKLTKIKNG